MIPIAVSRCLLGHSVRYDGGHARWRDHGLARHAEWVPLCPEVEIGMPIPREPVRLVQIGGGPRLLGQTSQTDWTTQMNAWAEAKVAALRAAGVRGAVLKSKSPSCGVERVKLYSGIAGNENTREGTGLFAAALLALWPQLPVEEEGRLNDGRLRRSFMTRIFVFQAWRQLVEGAASRAALMDFHGRHKMLLMAHAPARARALGQLVASTEPLAPTLERYELELMATLSLPESRGRHVNVMEHLAGFAKDHLGADDKRELAAVIDTYRQGIVPLEVPLTLLRHHLRGVGDAWALGQAYLQPYPVDLALRSAVIG